LLLDTMPFRRRPIWRVSRQHYLCVDPNFIVEKLAAGFYWAVNAALDSDESRYDSSSLWGTLVERYVVEVLRHAVPTTTSSLIAAPTQLVPNPFYLVPREEAFDAVVLEGTHAVVIQVKGLFVRASAKYSGRGRLFYRGIAKNFGNVRGAALEQLSRNIRLSFGIPRLRKTTAFSHLHTGDIPMVCAEVLEDHEARQARRGSNSGASGWSA
jgi:hypothetical protein